ncbi:MAG: VCBS repeat-containing protein, partial [Deltaproteobacteria bacterium]|nr:VCBS repeat-containing protein [Deltaproteobacteria bacterium]
MARHDRLRSSTADGTSNIDQPAASWRTYLGGSLGREQYLTFDIDSDGNPEVLFLMGGALLAKTPRDAVRWETEALDLTRIDGLHDLDGDGAPELIASARAGRLHVIRPTDGAVLWTLPAGVVGNMGNVRFADFDGDGVLDLYFADAACGSTGSLGDIAEAYTFAADVGSPTRLFALERGRRDYVCGGRDTIVDIDGDGVLEVVAQGRFRFYIYSTTDGSFESESEDVGSIPYGQATTVMADVDDDGRMELVCFTENNYAPPVNSRRVFVMDWDPGSTTLVKRWERSVASTLDDRHGWGPGGVFDLLGDGSTEVVTSFYTGSTDRWSTVVLSGADGTELDAIPVGPFRGLTDLDADGSPEILSGDDEVGLSAFSYTATGLERMFTAPGTTSVLVRDEPRHRTGSARTRALSLDVNRDGTDELIALRVVAGRTTELVALSGATDPPTEVASLSIDADVKLLTFEVFDSVTRDYPQLVVARSDGYMWVLDDNLQPTNASTTGEISLRGLRIGGYYSGVRGISTAPISADLDGDGAAEVLVRDSRGVLRRLGPSGATLVEPPTLDWEISGAVLPSIVDLTGDGTPEIVLGIGPDPQKLRFVSAADASTLWETTVGTSTRHFTYDIVPGQVGGDATLDLAYQLYETSGGTV